MPSKSKIGNPVLLAEAVNKSEVNKQVASVLPFLIKFAVVGTAGYLIYRSWSNRFVKISENSNYPQANVSLAVAKSKADAIEGSMGWFTTDYNTVAAQLTGLNYNGFVRVYNAFGKRRGQLFGGQLNLIEWLQDQFRGEDLTKLSFLLNGAFFRQAPEPTKEVTKKEVSQAKFIGI
ncbi:hypothetical protein [Flavobacterium capsici]|uniref:Uncharacterized protein n=1 Tax=Flavobacterium capsici TaxID=3075618 RepID=A0AA96J3G8_9FLAO|nr:MULTISPECIES: hypothetical protein [unclassified Flavobacterium]WNM19278.1 hypothetical protein RN608_01015 [Flavobacterium sp. PMR2A8]WNM20667.1 hypothetical protein RN605_08185 [Flavobacterium sp. PMTSA4]